jgi:hypothetical protein
MSFSHSIAHSELFPAGLVIDQTAADADQMKDLAIFWRIEQEQLEPGHYHGRISGVHTRWLQLGCTFRSRSTRVGGRAPAGALVIGVALSSKLPCYFRMAQLAPNEIAVVWPGEEFIFQPMGPSRVISVAVKAELAAAWMEKN